VINQIPRGPLACAPSATSRRLRVTQNLYYENTLMLLLFRLSTLQIYHTSPPPLNLFNNRRAALNQ
ncbi:hypothetical protein NP234_24970, partial [Salmonella enterica]|nr:hypothetical protein [Salmonella enterica]